MRIIIDAGVRRSRLYGVFICIINSRDATIQSAKFPVKSCVIRKRMRRLPRRESHIYVYHKRVLFVNFFVALMRHHSNVIDDFDVRNFIREFSDDKREDKMRR